AMRMPEINHQLTPTLAATVDSMNKLWQNDSMIAMIKTSFTVKSKEIIAPIPAYKFNAFPNTSGTAASPGKPINPIKGDTLSTTYANTGVYCIMVTSSVIGKITLPKVHVTFTPCCEPRDAIPFNQHPSFCSPGLHNFLTVIMFIGNAGFTTISNQENSTDNKHDRQQLCLAYWQIKQI